MERESKVTCTYRITTKDEDVITAQHESGDNDIYIQRRESGKTDHSIVLSLDVEAADELSRALTLLVIKMRHEEQEAQSTKENESNGK